MLWLVLKYYGVTFKEMFGYTIITLLAVNHLYCGWLTEVFLNKHRSEFATFGRWPRLKKRNNLPEPERRRFKFINRLYLMGQFGLMALLFGFGALAMHYHW